MTPCVGKDLVEYNAIGLRARKRFAHDRACVHSESIYARTNAHAGLRRAMAAADKERRKAGFRFRVDGILCRIRDLVPHP